MKSQKGFAHAFLVIGLIIALIGALGFIFWQNFIHKESVVKNDPIVVTKKGDSVEDTKTTQFVPEGYKLYKDEKLGFSLVYPDEWGALNDVETEQRPEFGIGVFGEKTKSVSDSKGIERITAYKKTSFYTKTAGGYQVRYQGSSVVGADSGSSNYETKSPVSGTNIYLNTYGDAGFISYDLFFEAGGSIIYVNIGDAEDSQTQITKTVKTL